jgi:hypothetical protein
VSWLGAAEGSRPAGDAWLVAARAARAAASAAAAFEATSVPREALRPGSLAGFGGES